MAGLCGCGLLAIALALREEVRKPVVGVLFLLLLYLYFPAFSHDYTSAVEGGLRISLLPEMALLAISYAVYEAERRTSDIMKGW
jgi:hypothetical protein